VDKFPECSGLANISGKSVLNSRCYSRKFASINMKIKLEKFEGPLDLLLQLIEGADLDITEIALAEVADQFMQYLEQVENKNPEELADFLVVASKLLLLKSKVLLPNLNLADEDSGEDLEKQLKIYREYYEASKKVEKILLQKNILFSRDKIAVDIETIFNPSKKLDAKGLRKIFLQVLKEIEPIIKIPKKSIERVVSIKEKIKSISEKINKGTLSFNELISDSKNKSDLIITFLGLLEMVKQKELKVVQKDKFSDIVLEKIG
jgi:segregation and condensation protein A